MKTFLKIAANALGLLGAAVAVINPKAVFAVDQPVAFVFLAASMMLGLIAYFLAGKSRFPDIGVVAATLVFIAFALTRFGPVRSQLVLAEHLGSIPYLGLGDRADLYRPMHGPKLIRSEKVMAFHEGLLRDYPTAETVVKEHGRYALVYAGRRVRGQSDDQILASPLGPRLFLGTLVSETFEPYWFGTMQWLQRELGMKPSAEWKMGLLPPDWAKQQFQKIVSNPPVDDASMIEGLIYIALRRPGFATDAQMKPVFDAWARLRGKDGYDIEKPLAGARLLAASLGASAAGEAVDVNFQYPPEWSPTMQADVSAELVRFLEAGGVHARVSSSGIPVAVSASPREWANVAYVFTDDQYRTVRSHTAGIHLSNGVYISGRDVSRQVLERRQVETKGKLGVPTLILRVRSGGQETAYGFAPVSVISKQTAEALWSCDPLKPAVGYTRASFEDSLGSFLLGPWRLGIYTPTEDDNRNQRSGENLY